MACWDRQDASAIAEAPVAKGSTETTDGSGVLQIDLTGSALLSGQKGLLTAHFADESCAGLWLVPVD